MLAQFRETRALPWILQLFRLPQNEALTGDVETEGLPQILASTCGGDIAPIQALIEDRAAGEWVRGAAVEALAVLVVQGLQPRDLIARYYGDLFLRDLEREPTNLCTSLIGACTDLRFSEHLVAIRMLYTRGVADPSDIGLAEVEKEIKSPPDRSEYKVHSFRLIDDTIAEMGSWYCFTPESAEEDELDLLDAAGGLEGDPMISRMLDEEYGPRGNPPVRAAPKIGRNDPCPCLSGLKYKKCCGR